MELWGSIVVFSGAEKVLKMDTPPFRFCCSKCTGSSPSRKNRRTFEAIGAGFSVSWRRGDKLGGVCGVVGRGLKDGKPKNMEISWRERSL